MTMYIRCFVGYLAKRSNRVFRGVRERMRKFGRVAIFNASLWLLVTWPFYNPDWLGPFILLG